MDLSLITYHLIIPLLNFFKDTLGSYGWSIVIVTILIKVVLYPLTKQQTDSMKKMQALQPKIKILQDRFNQQKERYKDRPAKLKEAQEEFQKEMMEFYQNNKVNPLGGCFPMLIQLPILIALFWAFNGSPFKEISVSTPIEVLTVDQSHKEFRSGASKPQIYVDKDGKTARFILNPGKVKIPVNSEVSFKVQKLEGEVGDVLNQLEWHVSDSPYFTVNYMNKRDISNVVEIKTNDDKSIIVKAKNPGDLFLHAVLPPTHDKESFLFISGLGKTGLIDPKTKKLNFDTLILVILFGVTIWLSGKVTQATSPAPADPKQAEMQKMMQTMMPPMIVMMMLMFPVPAGVLLYFVISGFIQALQTWLVMKAPVNPITQVVETKTIVSDESKKKEITKV